MKRKRLDAESILRQLAEIRRAIPCVAPAPPPPATDGRARDVDGMSSGSEEDFDYAAVADGLSSLAGELSAAIDDAAAAATEKALEIYYAAEELARDPAHAELIPHVERMRAAYERDFGRAVPGRKT
ncbi:MAG TPA: hypothetical protein VEO54_18915 [Thermoanaerobaculia bacterium]|nr:hypothetical protein [Thermoanaerobaculia bacterium]